MSQAVHTQGRQAEQAVRSFPRYPLYGGLALVLMAMLAAGVGRLTGAAAPQPTTTALAVRDFSVQDRPDGAVVLLDARDGHEISVATGENGFLRGTLRTMARVRRMDGLGSAGAFRLTSWADGRLTLDDLASGQRIDLEAFGSDNLAVFARLLQAPGTKP